MLPLKIAIYPYTLDDPYMLLFGASPPKSPQASFNHLLLWLLLLHTITTVISISTTIISMTRVIAIRILAQLGGHGSAEDAPLGREAWVGFTPRYRGI